MERRLVPNFCDVHAIDLYPTLRLFQLPDLAFLDDTLTKETICKLVQILIGTHL